ncbi:Ribonuclease H [Quillaja saponaria]|uniref:Ribonuclease H n=1 Tax=Quillaja saponaria TaxID=32244 RepID=A0AAD7LJ76_QUISA|nr:Ribonuclease H [Quillaja saponaria]
MDSTIALPLVEKDVNQNHPHGQIIRSIRCMMGCNWVIKVRHTYRKGNSVADWLASYALLLENGVGEV